APAKEHLRIGPGDIAHDEAADDEERRDAAEVRVRVAQEAEIGVIEHDAERREPAEHLQIADDSGRFGQGPARPRGEGTIAHTALHSSNRAAERERPCISLIRSTARRSVQVPSAGARASGTAAADAGLIATAEKPSACTLHETPSF